MKKWSVLLLVFVCGCSALRRPLDQKTKTPAAPQAQTSIDVTRGAETPNVLERVSLRELAIASQTLRRIASSEFEAEGEGRMGCRIEPEEAKRALNRVDGFLEKVFERERVRYARDPIAYAREAGFENCALRCECKALASLVGGVESKVFRQPKVRAAHNGYVKKLNTKVARQSATEGRECAEKQSSYCASDLRSELELLSR